MDENFFAIRPLFRKSDEENVFGSRKQIIDELNRIYYYNEAGLSTKELAQLIADVYTMDVYAAIKF
jgi:hypothetical protein